VAAILAVWLGLTVVTRARNRPGAPVFVLLTAWLAGWTLPVIVLRLTTDTLVADIASALADGFADLLPVGTLHVVLAITAEGRRGRLQQVVLVASYAASVTLAVGAIFFPDQQFSLAPPRFDPPGIGGDLFGWGWVTARLAMFAAALAWIADGLRGAGADDARRRQLLAVAATVGVGVAGGVLLVLSDAVPSPPFLGVSLVALGLVLASYAVFAQGLFLSPGVAAEAFRYTLLSGLLLAVLVAALVGLEPWVRHTLGVDFPILTGLSVVVAVALFDPISTRVRGLVRGSAVDIGLLRVMRALGRDSIADQPPDQAVPPALARLVRTFGLTGAWLTDASGAIRFSHGLADPQGPAGLRLPLLVDDAPIGSVVFGPKQSGLPVTPHESRLMQRAAGFLAGSVGLAEEHRRQGDALSRLSERGAEIESAGTELAAALGRGSPPSTGLHVFALGPLRIQRGGELIRRWGGPKAGSRQAEAIFAFLFDRGERGLDKEDAIELIWPDTDLERADLAFHRTLGGLRRTLEPGRSGSAAITFRHDRYQLAGEVVDWSDVAAFDEELVAAGNAVDDGSALAHLERARGLYRGDYLDDCPFFGDSAWVEERREQLRGRYVDLLVALGERYERRGDRPAAADCYREARSVAGGDLPLADVALDRLHGAA